MAHLHVKTLTRVGKSDSHQILVYTNTTYIHTTKKKTCSKYLRKWHKQLVRYAKTFA